MNLSRAWKYAGLLLLVAVCSCSANQSKDVGERRTPTPLNVTIPINKIAAKLNVVLKKGLNVSLIIDTVLELLPCLSPTAPKATVVPVFIPIKLQNELNLKIQSFLADFTNAVPKENITAYCNSDAFETIHKYVWREDVQFRDFMNFLTRFGYPNAYESIKMLYIYFECREGLADEIKPISNNGRASSQSQAKSSHVRSQVLSTPNSSDSSFQPTAECNILKILDLLQTGILELLQLVETIIEQVNTDPSLQFMIGKIQEPIKGVSFRKFREITEVRDLLDVMNEVFINDPTISAILDLAEALNLYLREINILETILNILEGILWGNFNPVPPRP